MGKTIKQILKPVGIILGSLIVVGGYIALGKDVLSWGLPMWAWQSIGAAIFFVSVVAILYSHQKAINQGLAIPKPKPDAKTPDIVTIPIRDWIDISAWFVHKQDLSNTVAYDIIYKDGQNDHVVEIRRSENEPTVITLASLFSIIPKSTVFSADEWARLNGQIIAELNRNHFQHVIPANGVVQIISQLYLNAPMDGLIFREKIMDVVRAKQNVIVLWDEAIRQSALSNPDKGDSQTK